MILKHHLHVLTLEHLHSPKAAWILLFHVPLHVLHMHSMQHLYYIHRHIIFILNFCPSTEDDLPIKFVVIESSLLVIHISSL